MEMKPPLTFFNDAMIFEVNTCLGEFQNSYPAGTLVHHPHLNDPQSLISHLMRSRTKCNGHRRPVREMNLCL
jgi:hypothetical protein